MGTKARLGALHFGEKLFTVLGVTKHGHDVFNMRNVLWDLLESRTTRRGEELRIQFIVALRFHKLHCKGGGQGCRPQGSQRGALNSLKSATNGLTGAKREVNSSRKEVTILTQLSKSTSSWAQVAR